MPLPPASMLAMCATIVLCFLLPALLGLYAARRERKLIVPVLLGAAGFALPQLLIRLPLLQLLRLSEGVQAFAAQHTALYGLLLAFTAALFETAGRVCVFRVALKKRLSYNTGFAAGLGHGGVEAVALVASTYLNYLLCSLLPGLGIPLPDAVSGVLTQLAAVPAATFLAAGVERAGTILFHIAMSVLVCWFVSRGKTVQGALLVLLIHTILDFVTVMLSAAGWNLWAIEGVIGLFALLSLLLLAWVRRRFAPLVHPDYEKGGRPAPEPAKS